MEHELDPSASLLSLSSQLSDAADDICEAEHVTLLRRRFASPESQAVLAAGVNGGGALVAQRVSQLNRLKQEQELDELRSSLAEAKAQADQEVRTTSAHDKHRSDKHPKETKDGTLKNDPVNKAKADTTK